MNTYYDRKEINEAIDAAEVTLDHLDCAADYLRSAGNWGIWDMLGGGLIATWGKHSKIDAAEAEIAEVKRCMKRLAKELSDIGYYDSLALEFDSFMRFADYWWDGLLIDWMVQDKIRNAQRNVADAQRKVYSLLEKLRGM